MQLQTTVGHRVANKWKGHQVVERNTKRCSLAGGDTRIVINTGDGRLTTRLFGDRHPRRNKLTGAVLEADISKQRENTATTGMTHHDHVLNVKTAYRELKCRGSAVITTASFARRNQVRDVTDNK